jgi:hypothetical protein
MNTAADYLAKMQVEWEGTETGLVPAIGEGHARAALEFDDDAIRGLIDALSDEDLFARAHIVLTQRSGVEYQGFPDWNGLRVELAADGTATIDPNQRFELARRWQQWHQTEPRPTTLPSGD